ncbi:MAG TPA: two-component regulator propeller domain-containing protein, partial [Marinagarivorans sp.]
MTRLLFIISTWLICCVGFTTSAYANAADSYPRKLSFVDVLKNRDIALGEVLSVAQDKHGFMWFGGRNALVRYDGYDFVEVFSAKDAAKTGSEPLVWVFGLHVDSDNQLWAGTRDGLFRLDRDYNVFRRIAPENTLLTQVNVIKQAPSGEILVGTYGGFSVLDKAGEPLKQFSGPLEDAEARGFKALLPNANIHAVTFNSEHIWLGTGVGLTRVDLNDDSVKNYIPFPENPQSTSENEIWSLDVAPNGHIWAGTHNGAYRFNPDKETFKRYQHDPKDRNSLGGNYIWDVLVDKQGWVWLCTDSGGVSLYDQQNDRFIRYDNVKSRPDSLKYSSTRKVFEDNIGDLWVTTFPTGINYYDRSTAAFDNVTAVAGEKNSLSDSNVWTLSEDSKGRIWLGTSGGVDRYTPASGEFANFTADNGGIALNNLISSHVDSKDRVWVGTWEGGLHRFSTKNNRFEVVPFAPELIGSGQKVHNKLIGKTVWNIREDDEGFLWLATHNAGLARYSPEQNQFVHYPSNPSDPETLTNSIVWTTFEDSRGNFWIGTVGGLNLFDKKTGKVTQRIYKNEGVEGALNNDSILSIYEDSQGRLWFGTNAGLHLYNYETQRFTFYGTKDGFSDMSIRSILESPQGELWLGTNNGVVRFDPQTQRVTNYKTYNGQQLGS